MQPNSFILNTLVLRSSCILPDKFDCTVDTTSQRNWSPACPSVAVLIFDDLVRWGGFVFCSLWHHTQTYYSCPNPVSPTITPCALQTCGFPQRQDKRQSLLKPPLSNTFSLEMTSLLFHWWHFFCNTFVGGIESLTSAPDGSTFNSSESWVMSTGSPLAGKINHNFN